VGKECRRGIWYKFFAPMYVNGKMRPLETTPGIGGGKIKKNEGGSEFKYNIFDIL
jgi:hypothetical protein